MLYYTFTLCMAMLYPVPSFCQGDKDIKEKEIPERARTFVLENYPGADHKKYYEERVHDSLFYEISFRHKGSSYDLRFLPDGTLYETERLLKFNELGADVQQKIREDLSARYSSYSIKTTEEVNPQSNLLYEITVRGKKKNHSGYFELFYNAGGAFISEEEETLKSIPSNSGF